MTHPRSAFDAPPLDVSVVIPTYRRPDLLERCLRPLLAQSLDASRYEIVVVDDGQTEDTRALVASLAEQAHDRPRLRYLRPHGTRGPAAARNRGWRAAEGEVIAFTDDDTVPDLRWLQEGWAAMGAGAGRPALRGMVRVPVEGPLTDHARMTQGLERAGFVTANCFVRRDALQRVGGFDERFQRAWREDSDLLFKLMAAYGQEIEQAPRALVLHPVRPAPFGISMKQQANMMFDALLYKKHPHLYRRLVGRRHAPPSYYAICGGSLGALAALALDAPLAAAALAALAIALVLRLALRRLQHTSRAPGHVAEMLLTSAAIPFLSLYWRAKGAWRFRVPFF
jgi:glycosyltransferase involved in cell wall biosynthesis